MICLITVNNDSCSFDPEMKFYNGFIIKGAHLRYGPVYSELNKQIQFTKPAYTLHINAKQPTIQLHASLIHVLTLRNLTQLHATCQSRVCLTFKRQTTWLKYIFIEQMLHSTGYLITINCADILLYVINSLTVAVIITRIYFL